MNSDEETIVHIGPDSEDGQTGIAIELLSNDSDHCLVTIEGQDDRTLNTSFERSKTSNDNDLAAKVPSLPSGKDKHLFVSHSSENFEEVMEIVNHLEERFNVSCIISDRDFEPGKDIFANIKGSMKRSLKNVFMLTPEFVQSGFCKFERDMAFMTSVESGISTVIPVLLQECDIPTSLVAVTYIDGTYPGVDIPAKIIQALIQSDLIHDSLIIEDQSFSRKYENGYCVDISPVRKSVCYGFKPSVTKFELREEDLTRIRQAKINLPSAILTEVFGLLNRRRKIKFDDIRNTRPLLCYSICTLPVWLCVFFILYILIGHANRMVPDDNDRYFSFFPLYYTLGVFIISAIVFLIFHRVFPLCKPGNCLSMGIWEHIGQQCIHNNTIVFVLLEDCREPTVHVMRYNFVDCKMYLAGLIRSKEIGLLESVDDPEVRADRMIDNAMKGLLPDLTPGLEKLPNAPFNRHNVRNSKMCICQMIEAGYI